ncbi:hypothetical protein tb265_19720 [Gemmatimonadetes bacterium T265]|nr:hypothetical protein tb265_19720 [Gemmatimonadetes bacterium T265]
MQWEDYAANGFPNTTRDGYMAENVGWLRAQLPAGARMMLWAHDLHVSRAPGWMGSVLGLQSGTDYVNVGFAFGTGMFNAFPTDAEGQITGPVGPQAAPPSTLDGFDAPALATRVPLFLLDARRVTDAGAPATFTGPVPVRMVGATYDPGAAATTYDYPTQLPHDFDLMIYVQTSTASTLLPFRYQ